MAFYSPLFSITSTVLCELVHHAVIVVHGGKINRVWVGRRVGCLQFVISSSLMGDGQSCISLAKAWLTRQARFPSTSLLISPMSIINQMAKTQEPNSEWLSVKVLECPFIRTVFACNCSWSVIQDKPNQKMRLKSVRKFLLFWHS